jgi:hypothetical protein
VFTSLRRNGTHYTPNRDFGLAGTAAFRPIPARIRRGGSVSEAQALPHLPAMNRYKKVLAYLCPGRTVFGFLRSFIGAGSQIRSFLAFAFYCFDNV